MRAVLANPGQYVRRINTATIGYIVVQFFETQNQVDIQWNGPSEWFETGVFLSELVACDVHGDQIGYLIWPHGEPRTADGEPETAPPVREDGSVVSGSPEVTESSPDHGSQIHDVIDDLEPANEYPPIPQNELHEWWMKKAAAEIDPMVAKMKEYGGTGRAQDLVDIGRSIARQNDRTVTDGEATEIGIAFYALGKISRIMAAIGDGRQPAEDSWYDLGIYSKMALRTREVGGWPE